MKKNQKRVWVAAAGVGVFAALVLYCRKQWNAGRCAA